MTRGRREEGRGGGDERKGRDREREMKGLTVHLPTSYNTENRRRKNGGWERISIQIRGETTERIDTLAKADVANVFFPLVSALSW